MLQLILIDMLHLKLILHYSQVKKKPTVHSKGSIKKGVRVRQIIAFSF